jgi:hypothetical protein
MAPDLNELVNQLTYLKQPPPPPPPIRMIPEVYIDVLRLLKSNDEMQREIWVALQEYNKISEKAMDDLSSKVNDIYNKYKKIGDIDKPAL